MNTTRKNGSLSTNIEQKIATVEFGHPASNSFPSEFLGRLTKNCMHFQRMKKLL